MGSLNGSRRYKKRFIRKLELETQKFAEKQNKKEEKKLIDEVGEILDNDFFIFEEDYCTNPLLQLHALSSSEESFCDNDVGELLSVKSTENLLHENFGEIFKFSSNSKPAQSVILHRPKRPKLDNPTLSLEETEEEFNNSITSNNEIELILQNENKILEKFILERIKEVRKMGKTLHNQKCIFELIRKYKLIHSTIPGAVQYNGSATLLLTKLHFSNIPKKIGRSDYFLLVSCGATVKTSKFVKTTENFTTFADTFTFENCRLDFCIRIEIYGFRLNSKLKMIMRKAPLMDKFYEWCKMSKEEKNDDLEEPSCFELVDQFELTHEDLIEEHEVGTIRDKSYHSKMFKYSLKVENLNIDMKKSGFLKLYIEDEAVWKRCWCTLSGTVLEIFASIAEEKKPILYFDLKYVTYTKIDENEYLILKYVRPSKENDKSHTILKSRNNFVIIKYWFKAVYLRYLEFWMRDINAVIKILDQWNFSFLYSSELEM